MRLRCCHWLQRTAHHSIRSEALALVSKCPARGPPLSRVLPTPPYRSCRYMSQFNRRGFMRTLLVTAVGALPAHATLAHKTAWPFLDSDLSPSISDLEHGPQQLRVSPTGSPFAFQNFLRINNEWKPATLPNNPFIA